MDRLVVTCRVNEAIYNAKGEHIASMWPRPMEFEPRAMYAHGDDWERDEMYLAAYRSKYPWLKDWTLDDFRDASKMITEWPQAGQST